jgi:hypothetical protein
MCEWIGYYCSLGLVAQDALTTAGDSEKFISQDPAIFLAVVDQTITSFFFLAPS